MRPLAILLLLCGCARPAAPERRALAAGPIRLSDSADEARLEHPSVAATACDWPLVQKAPLEDAPWIFRESGDPVRRTWEEPGPLELSEHETLVWPMPLVEGQSYRVDVELATGTTVIPPSVADASALLLGEVIPLNELSRTATETLARLKTVRQVRASLDGSIRRISWTFLAGSEERCATFIWSGPTAGHAMTIARLELRAEPLERQIASRLPSGVPSFRRHQALGEHRLSVLLLAGSRLRWTTVVPHSHTELHFGIAPLRERHQEWGREAIVVCLRAGVEGQPAATRVSREITAAQDVLAHGWQDWEVSLQQLAGQQVTLEISREMSVDGSRDVVAISDPMLMPTPDPDVELPAPVILISADTLRPDRLGCYGGPLETPALDGLAKSAVLFENAVSTSAFTLPSHASMLSGQHPLHHGANQNPLQGAGETTRFLAEHLHERGYLTAAYAGGGFVSTTFGFDRGFDRFSQLDWAMPPRDPRLDECPYPGERVLNEEIRAARGIEVLEQFIARHRRRPFFLFVHTFLTHSYSPTLEALDAVDPGGTRRGPFTQIPKGMLGPENSDMRERSAEDLEHLRVLYDATVWMLDQEIARLLQALRAHGVWDRCILVFTSDHGEELGEHMGLGHGRTLYEETVRVPLIVRFPGCPGGARVRRLASLMDVTPTILGLLGVVSSRAEMDGIDLVPLIEGAELPPRTLLLENRWRLEWERYALRGENDKLIVNLGERGSAAGRGPDEQYDLARDPGEHRPLRPDEEALRFLESMRARYVGRRQDDPLEVNDPKLGELRALGYVIDQDD